MLAIKFDKCQVAATLSLIYSKIGENPAVVNVSLHVAIAPSRLLMFSAMSWNLSKWDSAWYIDWFLTLYLHEVDSTWKSKTALGWISRSVTHWDIHIAWVLQCGEVCGRSAATGDILVAFLCSLRCLVDCSAKWSKPIHALKFISQICGMYVPQASRINSSLLSECLTPYSTKFSSIGTSSVKNIK